MKIKTLKPEPQTLSTSSAGKMKVSNLIGDAIIMFAIAAVADWTDVWGLRFRVWGSLRVKLLKRVSNRLEFQSFEVFGQGVEV